MILRSGPGDAHLAPRFDSGDGIHPSAAAYDLMDHALLEVLRQVDKP